MTELKRVLVVEDEESVLFVLNGALSKMDGHYRIESHRARSADQAMAKAQEIDLNLLITDIRLPGIGGIELTEQIKRLQPEIGVVWITAYGCQKLLEDAHRLGVYKCLDKPLEIAEIRQTVRAALQERAVRAGRRNE